MTETLHSCELVFDPQTRTFEEVSTREMRIASKMLNFGEGQGSEVVPQFKRQMEPGGMIIMSTDVNAMAGGGLTGKLKALVKTTLNRLFRSDKAKKVIKDFFKSWGMSAGMSIGRSFNGVFYDADEDVTYDENSFTVDLKGVPFPLVSAIGASLAKAFDQKSVLVEDNRSGTVFEIGPAVRPRRVAVA